MSVGHHSKSFRTSAEIERLVLAFESCLQQGEIDVLGSAYRLGRAGFEAARLARHIRRSTAILKGQRK